MIWDAHCHLADPRWDGLQAWRRAREAGVTHFLQGGVDPQDWQRQSLLPAGCYASFGLHPWRVHDWTDEELQAAFARLTALVAHAAAIGETGLDLAPRFASSRERQLFWLDRHLHLAAECGKPLILHVVRGHEPVLQALRRCQSAGQRPLSGLVHAFHASPAVARAYRKLGFLLSFGSSLLGAEQSSLAGAVAETGLLGIVVESDAPDRPPRGERGHWNEPTTIFAVARAVARIANCQEEDVLKTSAQNLCRLLELPHES
jgi:TatD DNase family protein